MNRRRLVHMSFGMLVAGYLDPLRGRAAAIASRQPTFLDYLDIDPDRIEAAHTRGFQHPAPTPAEEHEGDLYWVRAFALRLESRDDIALVLDGTYRSVPAWYVDNQASLTLRGPSETSLGGMTLGEGARAWYWDVDAAEALGAWATFGLGCLAVWRDRSLLLVWGCAPIGNPVEPLVPVVAEGAGHWSNDVSSFAPLLDELPTGFVLVDDVALSPADLHGEPDADVSVLPAVAPEMPAPTAVATPSAENRTRNSIVVEGSGTTVSGKFHLSQQRYRVDARVELTRDFGGLTAHLYGPSDVEILLFNELIEGGGSWTAATIVTAPESGEYFVATSNTRATWRFVFTPF